MYDFANILFSGPCSARCTFCIGRQINPELNTNNLNTYPPRNLDTFLDLIWQHKINQVVLTGSSTDPQLYRYESKLLAYLRLHLPPRTKISLHTNGLQALRRIELFNQYDRATLSLPTFDPQIYQRMMGRIQPPDLKAILHKALIPVKISCLVTSQNRVDIPAFLTHCAELDVRRIVLRKLYNEKETWSELLPELTLSAHFKPKGSYRNNTVYDYAGIEVTLWDFNATHSRSLNLFSNGHISDQYLLSQASAIQV